MLMKPAVLDEDVTPEHELVVHRQDELRRLRRAVSSGTGSNIAYIFGPPGTGKTMCARLVADQLSPVGHSRSAYINCWHNYERYDVLFRVAEDLCEPVVHRSSTGRGALVDMINDLNETDRWVICDEADQLRDKAVLYDLFETDLNLIAIGNSEDDFFEGMDDRLRSRLAIGKRIEFGAYSATEISAILAKRSEHAFHDPGAISDRQLDWLAERVDGDARRAIRALREAATLAEEHHRERGEFSITDADLEAALPKAVRELRQKSLDQLHEHQRALYDILLEAGPLAPRELQERYEERVDQPRVKRTVRDYLAKMEHYNHVTSQGANQSKTWDAIPIEE